MLARTFLNKKVLASKALKATTRQTTRSYIVMMRQTASKMSSAGSMGKDMHRLKANRYDMRIRFFNRIH